MIHFKDIPEEDAVQPRKFMARTNTTSYFRIAPQVVPSNRRSTLTVTPRHDYLRLSGNYFIMVSPYLEHPYRSFACDPDSIIEVTAENGVLRFSYDFLTEQMYRIVVAEQTAEGLHRLLQTEVYALDEDILFRMPLIGDLHCHTIYSDGIEPPDLVLDSAIRHGLDFIAVTDHNNYQGSVEAQKSARERKLPITVLGGEEFSSSFTNMHIISLGAPRAVDPAWYLPEPTAENQAVSVEELTGQLCQAIHEAGGLSVMCHPLWKPLRPDGGRMDVSMSLVRSLMGQGLFDAIEVVSGSPEGDCMTSHMQALMAQRFGATPDRAAYLGSTDSHTYSIDPICGKHFTMVFAEGRSQSQILEAIRQRRTVAVQLIDDCNALCFGDVRLSMYAQFCLKHIHHKIH